jgi:peptide/nickel transport system substrate-binding protein
LKKTVSSWGKLQKVWESSADATKWKFTLQSGVTFHNGKKMTSVDVIYSINLHRGKDSASGAKGLLGSITDLRPDGPNAMIAT